ncbi:UPF0182 family protein [bacterium]|nr:MAG: UPF0182 family protein [bacterium]
MKKWVAIGLLAVFFFYVATNATGFYTELLWFRSLGYENPFWTMYTSEYLLGFVYFAVFWIIIGSNILIASRVKSVVVKPGGEVFQQQLQFFAKPAKLIFFGLLLFVSYIMAAAPATKWMRVLQYFNSESFGELDSVFQKDIGFYVYELPFYQSIINWLFGVLVVTIIATAAVHVYKRAVNFTPQGVSLGQFTRRHIMVLIGLILFLYAFDYHYSQYDILYKDNGIVVGAGYTDVNAALTGYMLMQVIALVGACGAFISAFKGTWRWLIGSVILQFGAAFLLLNIYPSLIQRFVVKPNELEKEKPYIEENIKQTRRAYELDKITEKDFKYDLALTSSDIKANNATIKNVTLWDYRPLRDSYSQLQEIRPYYNFYDVDIDRYFVNGEYRQVMLSARELNLQKIGSDNWINKTFIYTHGHGIVMSPVNVVTTEGQPEFFIKNIPPEKSVDITLDRPEIYFGELQGIDDYIVVKTSKEEFDFPLGEKNQHTFYKEDAGVGIGSFARKAMFAIRFGKFNFLLNDYIQPESKIIYYRNINDRIKKLIPYIKLDKDPYMVAENGRLYWIYDGFTTTNQYPYAKMSYEKSSSPFGAGITYNYIRNSVKVVIDAYNGSTQIYSFNSETDPLIRVYAKIFPGVFKPIQDMPEYLRKHLRYPQDLFDIQAKLFTFYHVDDANVFFNREDEWNIATEKYGDDVKRMESYYVIMRLPGESKEEFLLMVPFTPNTKPNMIAWFCARSDGDNYGKLLVYKFPKSELVYGPLQVESRIDQTPEISEKLTLWNQQGSSVTRGNLLVIPINNSVLYVEPLYLQSQQSKMPELKKVIVAFDNYIFMEDNLENGLEKIFGGNFAAFNRDKQSAESAEAASSVTDKNVAAISSETAKAIRDLSRSAMDNYNNAQDALKKGNWTKYGESLERLKKDLEKLSERSKGIK